jgi:hypothetical protein
MRISGWAATVALTIAITGPVWAVDESATRADYGGVVRETDVGAVFDYLRSAVVAAAEGRDAPIPETLRQRAVELDAEVKMRSALAVILLLNEIEAGAKQLLKDLRGSR